MKQLMWKEWRENRLIIVWAVLLAGLFYLVPVVAAHSEHSKTGWDVLVMVTYCVWLLSALLCGSTLMAPEIGNGSLQLLSSLPISRSRIWWMKIGMGLLVLLASIVLSSVTMAILGAIGMPLRLVSSASGMNYDGVTSSLYALGATLPLFAVGCVVTMLTDRTISALMGSVVVAVLIYALLGFGIIEAQAALSQPNFSDPQFRYENYAVYIVIAIVTASLFAISYKLFTTGETLKTRKRFRILAGYLLPPAFIGAAIFLDFLIISA